MVGQHGAYSLEELNNICREVLLEPLLLTCVYLKGRLADEKPFRCRMHCNLHQHLRRVVCSTSRESFSQVEAEAILRCEGALQSRLKAL